MAEQWLEYEFMGYPLSLKKTLSAFLIFTILGNAIPGFSNDNKQEKPALASWLGIFGPSELYHSYYKDYFPSKMIIEDNKKQGITDILTFMNDDRGGPAYYQSQLIRPVWQMGKRDFLEEILSNADQAGIRVWLGYTPGIPKKNQSGTNVSGLDKPEIIKLYGGLFEEIAQKIGHHKSLFGTISHETNNAMANDDFADKRDDFSKFCEQNFGESYNGKTMPPPENPEDKWWRRFFLYKIHVHNNFYTKTNHIVNQYGLKTMMCLYPPESHSSPSWTWGWDPVEQETIFDNIWCVMRGEEGKGYQHMKGIYLDTGIAYVGSNISKNLCYGFHGKPISFFDFRTAIYTDAVRYFYRNNREKQTGKKSSYDFYVAYMGFNKKETDLFYGPENVKKWNDLINSWQGGSSPARIAVASSCVPFMMRYPDGPGRNYQKQITQLMEKLTEHVDVDGVILGSVFSLDAKALLKYKLIIIPQDVGAGLSQETAESLRKYVHDGGRLLAIATPFYQSRKDLTEVNDLTEEFFGFDAGKTTTGAFIKPVSESNLFSVPSKKIWVDAMTPVITSKAKVLIRDSFTRNPLLMQNGNAYFSTIGFNASSSKYFTKLVEALIDAPVKLQDSKSRMKDEPPLRLLESVQKDNVLCLSFFNQGTATLQVDISAVGITGSRFQIKNIIKGNVLAEVDADKLQKGIPVEIKNFNEPYVLAIGDEQALSKYRGIYPASEDFSGLERTVGPENPEVPILVPDKPGIRVGVYHSGLGKKTWLELLNSQENINAFTLPRLDSESLASCKLVVIPQSSNIYVSAADYAIKEWVEKGGRILFSHDAVTYGKKQQFLFPSIAIESQKICYFTGNQDPVLSTVDSSHPIVKNIDKFSPDFKFDYYSIKAGPVGKEIMKSEKGYSVVVAGNVGSGKVVLMGIAPCWGGDRKDCQGRECMPSETEKKLLINTINWLAK